MAESICLTNRHITYRFKGKRDYIHGTDIYTAIENTLVSSHASPLPQSITQFRLAIRKPSHHSCRLDISPISSTNEKPDTAVVEFQFCFHEQTYRGWLSEIDSPVSERYDYSEQPVFASCTVNKNTVSLINCAEYTMIENLVAATKHLHATRFPDADGKWFFSRLDLPQLLPTQAEQLLTITLNQCVGKRLTRSAIQLDNQSTGSIYFSLVPA